MFSLFPALPAWVGLHPLVVHFPIALLLVAPLLWAFVVYREYKALAAPAPLSGLPGAQGAEVLALAVLWIGALASIVAVETGEAAGELVSHTAAAKAVLEQHEDLAEAVRTMAITLALFFTGIFVVNRLDHFEKRTAYQKFKAKWNKWVLPMRLVGLLGLVGLAFLVANAAHQGGQLVHVHGIKAQMGTNSPQAGTTAPTSARLDHDGDDD